ncbi:MAG: sigma-70 family RNA polymerase sigma factor [candidate division Zixibacteria bacterium]|nr:sigma-70 family RNA polymerase sigma factor [candidate division Zixibacteria bacterium]
MKGPKLKDGFKKGATKPEADEILIKLIVQKDEKALSVFYDMHGRLIYSLVLKLLGNKPDAEEVTQETFLKVWDNAEKYNGNKGSVKSWLVTMARRLAIDKTRSKHYKMRNRESAFAAPDGSGPDSQQSGKKVESADYLAEAREIKEALAKLDDQCRNVIHLSYYEGYSHSEISKHLNMPLGTVKHRIRQGVEKLRQVFL